MPRIGFETANKRANANDYPKVYLDNGERARVLVIETGGKVKGPEVGFAHTLRMPVLVDGKLVMETQQRGKETVEAPKMEFVGRHICIGSFDILSEKGVDPDGCPACKASKDSAAVDAPQRRFAMHVVQYKISPGSFNVQDPFQVELKAWAFTDMVFTQLVDFAEEWGDLKQHDLMLGPCTNKNFQKFDLNVAGKAEWLLSEERKNLVAATYKNNQCPDLTTFIGRKLSREQVMEDVEKVLIRYKQAYSPETVAPTSPQQVAAEVDIDALLGDSGVASSAPAAAESVSVETLAPAPEPAATPPAPEAPKGEVVEDLDDLLAGL